MGAGAAGLATAIFAKRAAPALPLLVLDGAKRPGAKILVSGGSRCNVTNAVVTEQDYWGGKRTLIRRVLANFTIPQTIAFFAGIGVPLKEEPNGKLFPVSDRSRDVLDALMNEAAALGTGIRPDTRVHEVTVSERGFMLETSRGVTRASRVVLATGGLSLPKTGSDGAGLAIARRLGHTIVPTTPALAPLLLDGDWHAPLSGVAHDVELVMTQPGAPSRRIRGAMLWTHFGVSGPAALDMSRHLLRCRLAGAAPRLTVRFVPGRTFEQLEQRILATARAQPRATIGNLLGSWVPASLAAQLLARVEIDGATRLAQLQRDHRRRLVHALDAFSLDFADSRGYNYAEATAGGVALDEVDPATMQSRRCGGLYLVGEMLDVDGRLGGFNFQWAWASGRTAGVALADQAR